MMKIMSERALEGLIKTIESEVRIPEGIEEKILVRVFASESEHDPYLMPFERFVYEKPLRIAACISVAISGMLWSVMGGSFANWLIGFIR
ncbi:hypothetical protein [Fusibacter ferrireducens]|uniref:Uncharacterized protein n=1 Tax=Fusibacter ferrireducens TaxID=2785058 RepID=A0ABR9ZR87_9FIRM|nr:hypothetical protein [Fusibacter ferrireducens]MBF4692491.1 hypothetical protein [Fusibacter ferrireducens]